MGTWSASIFGDDTALDIRSAFREMIADGLSPEKATKRLTADFAPSAKSDPDEAAIFWLALAATQWQCGRLLPKVKAKALKILDAGADLRRWREENPKAAPKRRAALTTLRTQLLSPQPAPKKLRNVFRPCTDWQIGHALIYRLRSGRSVIFRIVHVEDSQGSRIPIADLCDWIGDDAPPLKTIPKLRRRHTPTFEQDQRDLAAEPGPPGRAAAKERDRILAIRADNDGKFALYSSGPRDHPPDRLRILATGLRIQPSTTGIIGADYFGGWKHLDNYLADTFGLR
jgi:hypothetical protein